MGGRGNRRPGASGAGHLKAVLLGATVVDRQAEVRLPTGPCLTPKESSWLARHKADTYKEGSVEALSHCHTD